MSLTWCTVQKENLSAHCVVILVFVAQIVGRFCKFQDLFSDTEADSVIRQASKNFSICYSSKNLQFTVNLQCVHCKRLKYFLFPLKM